MRMNSSSTSTSSTPSTSSVSHSAVTALQLPTILPFSLADFSTLGQRWSKWVKSLEYFLIASRIMDPKQKWAVLLHFADRRQIYVFTLMARQALFWSKEHLRCTYYLAQLVCPLYLVLSWLGIQMLVCCSERIRQSLLVCCKSDQRNDAICSVAHSFPATRATLPSQPSLHVEELVTQYSSLFKGVGKLKNYQLKIHTDPNATPVVQPLRWTPFHILKDVEKKLQQLADLDIIEDVEGPTPWVSPLVAVPKPNGEVRVCVDMRRVNEAVGRERHPILTLAETLQAMNGSKVFFKTRPLMGLPSDRVTP